MAKLRILFLISLFIPLQTFAQEGAATAAAGGAEAVEPLTPDLEMIRAEAAKIKAAAATAGVTSAAKVVATTTSLKTTGGTCEFKKKAADAVCLETLNPEITGFVSEYGDLINMGIMVGGTLGEQCKGISSALTKAGTVLGLYQAACKVAQTMCNSTCAKVMPDISAVQASLTAAVAESAERVAECAATGTLAAPAVCTKFTEAAAVIKTSAAAINAKLPHVEMIKSKKELVCNKYQISTQQAMMGALSALKGLAQSKQCEEKTSSTPVVANLDCANTASPGYASINCQCARGEKTAADCQNIKVGANNIKPGSIALPNTGNPTSTEKKNLGLGDLGGDNSPVGTQTAALSGAGAPVDGGGSGLGGGGNGQGGSLGQDGAGSAKRLNANVLGGGFGGGGGGGGGSAGPGYGMDEKLKDYMPGGKNDPNRSIASQIGKEVTPEAGRTNWEKVKLRYRDNYSSLLNK